MASPSHPAHLRSWDIISLLSPKPLWRVVRGMVRAPLDPDHAGSPLAVCWFVTFACNARCSFCCKAKEVRQGKQAFPPLPLADARRLLAKIRATVDNLYISGGEPLVHPQIVELLAEARKLNFRSIGMSSNLIALDARPEVLDYLDIVAVSIHSPEPAGQAANLGVPESVAGRVFENLEMLRTHPRQPNLKVVVNCVINTHNMDRIVEMVDFTAQRGFLLEIVPANDHGSVPKEISDDPRYPQLIDTLLDLRHAGKAPHLAGSSAYYRRLRTLKPFRCFPYGVPNILPDGRLCTPCDVSGQHALSVLDCKDLKAAVRASMPMLGRFPCRQGRCFKAGIVERSRLFGLLLRTNMAR